MASPAGAEAAQCGKAAWYDLDGQTASGERSDGSALAAAHRSLPFGTKVRVENLANGREVVVRVNDRGPFVGGRVIDVTRAAAEKLGMINSGIARVRVSVVSGDASLDGACTDAAPRVITADAVAGAASKADPEAVATDRQEPQAEASARQGTIAATTRPATAAKSGKVLVATVRYDEGTGEGDAGPPPATSGESAAFSDQAEPEAALEEETVVAFADIPLPRPRPPVFGAAAPGFNNALALRFLDAFRADDSNLRLTVPLGYAPTVPRGAVITE